MATPGALSAPEPAALRADSPVLGDANSPGGRDGQLVRSGVGGAQAIAVRASECGRSGEAGEGAGVGDQVDVGRNGLYD